MIYERFMVTGKQIDNGNIIIGQYISRAGGVYVFPENGLDSADRYRVAPDSVEPVSVKVLETNFQNVYKCFCPNCETTVKGVSEHRHYKYCPECGQRLDWGEKNGKQNKD